MRAAVRSSGFAVVPYQLMDTQRDYKIWGVYACLHRHGWNSEHGCFASVATISHETGICEKVVQRSLAILVKDGWVDVQPRHGMTTVYHIKVENLGQKEPGSKMTRVKNAPGTPGKNAPPTWGKNAPLTRTQEQEPITRTLLKLESEFPAVSESGKQRTRTKGPDEFERFWKLYLSAPVRAASQSKPKALAQWKKTISHDSNDVLIKALESEIAHQQAASGSFVCPLPDCFRWLRDERFATVDDRPINITSVHQIPDVIR